MPEDDYIKINRAAWNQRVPVHLQSKFYDLPRFLQGHSSLQSIELGLLGNIEGKSVLHLQCHFGQDTISLARLGAKVTGVDFSDKAIEAATALAQKTHSDVRFICCDVYALPQFLHRPFDIVFTSYGTIGWLPNLDHWAYIVSKYLKPGGRFVMVEFHPFVWMFDNDFTKISYSYFNCHPISELNEGTYTDGGTQLSTRTISWNHGLSEVIQSLIGRGLQIEDFKEYDYSPYNCFAHTREMAPGRFIIEKFGENIPLLYSICAQKIRQRRSAGMRGA